MANFWTPLHTRLETTVKKGQLLPKNASLLVALSAGQDSLCLGQLLLDLRSRWGWQLAIAHCDHRWSYDGGLVAHVQKIAEIWQLPVYIATAPPMAETEAKARQWRYQALQTIAQEQGFNYLLTAHTRSDRAETFLYNLTRGAGSDGLSALTWLTSLTPDIFLVRPLLNVTRGETFAFCQGRELPIWYDRANENLRYARNRIRRELLPYLQTNLNPQIEKHLAQTAEILEAESDYLDSIAWDIFRQVIDLDQQRLDRSPLQILPLAIQRRVIRLFLAQYLPSSPNFAEVESVVNLITGVNRDATSSLTGKIRVEVQQNWLYISDQ
ncbi:tRNA lysidine(34) synthetase TilS [Microcystis aeruginosa CS-555/01A07]|uniref:tRNA lysidine(34) synthetase TilS n=1 Tax=Microcystis aeruginosa TaxID=1126 RepID=UPI00232E0AC8|nr:tRNA lysidine(34) synthetase TilS [Microcystis aeruginosa]MDB9429887.1 tRNA lysidine(34) synthetase TilS [Microcystis aeruginosa CS-555/01A07]